MISERIIEIEEHLTGLGLGALVTTDQRRAASTLHSGRPVVVINPPQVTVAAAGVYEFEFSVIVAAAPFDNAQRATAALDPIVLGIMESVLAPSGADPSTFETFEGRPYPCYVLNCTTYSE